MCKVLGEEVGCAMEVERFNWGRGGGVEALGGSFPVGPPPPPPDETLQPLSHCLMNEEVCIMSLVITLIYVRRCGVEVVDMNL